MRPRYLGLALAAAVTTAAIAFTADWSVVRRAGAATLSEPVPMLIALAAYTAAFVLRAAAWGPLLPAPVTLGRRLRAILAMLAVNHALPGPVGEVTRARLVTGVGGITFRGALASVAAARVVDVGALSVLAMGGATVAGEVPAWVRLVAPAAAVLPLAAWALACRKGAHLSARQAARVAAWALPSWVLEAGVVLVVARAGGVKLSLAAAVLATCGGVLAQAAAVLPGGVGTYEAGVASVLVPLGVPLGEAVGLAATTHAVKFAFAFAAGGLALVCPTHLLARSGPQTASEPAENAGRATAGAAGGGGFGAVPGPRAADARP